MADVYEAFNGAGPTTAAPVAVTTGTTVKTMICLSTSANRQATITEWGWEGAATAAATPAVVELMFHSTGAPTVTAYTAATDFKKYNPNSGASQMTVGVNNSGFSASSEGTPATALGAIVHQISPTTGMYFQYQYGREPRMDISTFARIRNTITPAVNATCMVAWEE